ncbi:MAG: hypothetical protein LBJ20_07005 [Candidatus Methanoplasma sp.]|jgi:hypothetical protein|nr:hypothetical protein [Candidatus Methanoplasma sp.]
MTDAYLEAMRNSGFSYETTVSLKKHTCPHCGFEFSLVYARTFACQGCSEALRGCPKVRCDKCDTEFYIKDLSISIVKTKEDQRTISDHICSVVSKYRDDMGYSPNR